MQNTVREGIKVKDASRLNKLIKKAESCWLRACHPGGGGGGGQDAGETTQHSHNRTQKRTIYCTLNYYLCK